MEYPNVAAMGYSAVANVSRKILTDIWFWMEREMVFTD